MKLRFGVASADQWWGMGSTPKSLLSLLRLIELQEALSHSFEL